MRVWRVIAAIALVAGVLSVAAPASAALPTCTALTTYIATNGQYVQFPTNGAGTRDLFCKLRRGDRNWGVVALQQSIHFCGGRQVEVDGIYGPITEDAIEWTQAANGLTVDGVYGPDTKDVLPVAVFEGNHRFVRCAY
jgi:peptidoglycan hydrolase-like protein with peptidoglycan-binding domain